MDSPSAGREEKLSDKLLPLVVVNYRKGKKDKFSRYGMEKRMYSLKTETVGLLPDGRQNPQAKRPIKMQ